MKPIHLIFLSPLLFFAELYAFSWMAELLRLPSDTAVLMVAILGCVLIAANSYLVIYIIKTIKNKQTK